MLCPLLSDFKAGDLERMHVISNKFSFVGKLPEMRVAPAQMS